MQLLQGISYTVHYRCYSVTSIYNLKYMCNMCNRDYMLVRCFNFSKALSIG